ncbi:hypothetical protein HDR60_04525 [bacterium]|nr:hypothetical protein [bacterium]
MKKIIFYMFLFFISMNISANASIYQCKACPAGSISTSVNSASCSQCPAGTYSEMGGTSCLKCPAGYYCPGGTDKILCPEGKSCEGSTSSPTSCPAGTYSEKGGSSCLECPAGYYCPGGTDKILCPAGKYCARSTHYTNRDCNFALYYSLHMKECDRNATHSGATAPKDCPSGKYQPYKGASSCLSCNTTVESCDYSYKSCSKTKDCDSYRGCVAGCILLAWFCDCSECEECTNKTREGHMFVYKSASSDKTSCSSTSESQCYDGAFTGK